jgi:8-oxo-dGTP pyrophosphatase MutT (NUDIX family)
MIEKGETPEMAACREVLEETGLRGKLAYLDLQNTFWIDPALAQGGQGEISDTPTSPNPPEPLFNTETCFHMEVPADSPVELDATEHDEYRWCAPDEAMALMIWEGGKEALRRVMMSMSQYS